MTALFCLMTDYVLIHPVESGHIGSGCGKLHEMDLDTVHMIIAAQVLRDILSKGLSYMILGNERSNPER
jgi:hypothetical protein